MSKLFYDHLIVLEKLEVTLSSYNLAPQEKEEIHHQIEEIVHHRVMSKILDHLHVDYHLEFLEYFSEAPYHAGLLSYLQGKIENIEEIIKEEVQNLETELLGKIQPRKISRKISKRT